MKIAFVLIAVLLLSPLLFKGYLHFIPGEMIGSIDGWLGFLGGYLGGLIAFISAVMLFYKQRIENVRPYLNLCRIENIQPEIVFYFIKDPSGTKIDPENFHTINLNRSDLKALLTLKNIGLGPALNIKIFNTKGLESIQYSIEHKWFTKFKAVTSLDAQEVLNAFYCFDTLCKGGLQSSFNEILKLEYNDIYGTKYVQNLYFEYNHSNNKCGFDLCV
jgi:hypothetical protein